MQNEKVKSTNPAEHEKKASSQHTANANQTTAQKTKKIINEKAKSKSTKPKSQKALTQKSSMVAPKKIKLLFTVVNRRKTEFFVDVLQNFEVNMQLVLSAQGTASDHIVSLLGLQDNDKSVIISVIRHDKIKDALAALEEKFHTVKGGKGIAYTIPIKSAIGVAIYRFLSNTSGGGLING